MLQMILMLNAKKIQLKKILNLKQVIKLNFQNAKAFLEGYLPNWAEEVFLFNKIKNTVPLTYVVTNLNSESIIGSFYEKELQETSQKELRIEKVLKRKGDKLYVKWKPYNSSFNSWIHRNRL